MPSLYDPTLQLGSLPLAVLVMAALLAWVLGTGGLLLDRVRRGQPELDPGLEASATVATGLLTLEVLALAAGHLHLLYSPLLVVVGLVGAGCLWLGRTERLAAGRRVRAAVLRQHPALLAVFALAVLLVFGTAVAGPSATDELAYHWPSPLFWASHHSWARSPYVTSNGPALAEHLYTLPALVKSSTAAHWLHATTWLALAGGVASLARRFGVPAGLAAAAATTFPAVLIEARVAYNDTFMAMFLVVGLALVLAARPRDAWHAPTLALGGFVLAGAASIKTFGGIGAVLGVVAVLLTARRGSLRAAAWVVGPVVLVVALWGLRTLAVTGHVVDPDIGMLVHSRTDPTLSHGGAPGRIPTPLDVAKLPVLPFLTGIIGNREPYGGRTGFVALLLLPVAVVLLVLRRRSVVRAAPLLVLGFVDWFVLGPVLPKVRFNLVCWVLLTVFSLSWGRLRGRWWQLGLTALILVQVLDDARVVVPLVRT